VSVLHALWLLRASFAACRTHAHARTPARVSAAHMQQLGAEVGDVMGGSALITGPCLPPCGQVESRYLGNRGKLAQGAHTARCEPPLLFTHPPTCALSTPPGGLNRRDRVRVQVLYSPMPIIWLKPMEEAQIPDWPHFNTPMCVAR
jgi:hypothetical protein